MGGVSASSRPTPPAHPEYCSAHSTPQMRNFMHRHMTTGWLLGVALGLLATLTTDPDDAAAGDAVTVWNANAVAAAMAACIAPVDDPFHESRRGGSGRAMIRPRRRVSPWDRPL